MARPAPKTVLTVLACVAGVTAPLVMRTSPS